MKKVQFFIIWALLIVFNKYVDYAESCKKNTTRKKNDKNAPRIVWGKMTEYFHKLENLISNIIKMLDNIVTIYGAYNLFQNYILPYLNWDCILLFLNELLLFLI
jgi:hypothetical protein